MGVLVFRHLHVFPIFYLFGIPIIGLAQTPLNDHSWDNVFDDNFETLNTTRWYLHGTSSDEDATISIELSNGPKSILRLGNINNYGYAVDRVQS